MSIDIENAERQRIKASAHLEWTGLTLALELLAIPVEFAGALNQHVAKTVRNQYQRDNLLPQSSSSGAASCARRRDVSAGAKEISFLSARSMTDRARDRHNLGLINNAPSVDSLA